ncbi:MAG: SpoIIE family protein phosphatase [Anaerovibrio sp.]|uniref:PP2C family protein-serine/threonine phosphatase n=1 Tax=Anaerovibrio sp. TaxID=1872532 RepID=UPI0025ECE419|nr:SpoIIE family protein phosphatase [Anaerovibrio sp.]MCR5176394.1 SpoIIE family protein phosphatase [Anaerovibrio sp.]
MGGQGLVQLNNKKRTKKRRLMVEVVMWLLLVFLIFFLTNRITATYLANKQFHDYLDVHLMDSAVYTRAILHEYDESLPWLISYWAEHREEMDIPRNGFGADNDKWVRSHKWYKDNYNFLLGKEELDALSAEQQKEYAEFCYLLIAQRFDLLANTYDYMYFTCTKDDPASDGAMILFSGMNNENSNPYELGTLLKLKKVEKPVFSGAFEAGDGVSASYVTVSEKKISQPAGKAGGNSDEGTAESDYSYYAMTIPVYDKDHNRIASVSVGYDRQLVETAINDNIRASDILILIRTIVVCLVVIFLMRRKFIKPLETISQAVRDYMRTKESTKVATNLDAMIRAPKKTEIELLAGDIYDMSLEIDRYTDEIRFNATEKEKTRAEMEMATSIQMGQLPSISDEIKGRKEFDLFASMLPAREVGGDFYDFFMLDNDHLVLVIADVSDKGVPAALFMMTSKTLIRSELKAGQSLADAISNVNKQLYDTNPTGMFVTVWVAVLELSTGILRSVNAGHEKPSIKRADWKWEQINTMHDLPLACMPQIDFKENEILLKPGDILFVYTDGVLDASNKNGNRFGIKRMTEALKQCWKEQPEALIGEMTDKIAEFVGEAEYFDDITMLCFKYHGLSGDRCDKSGKSGKELIEVMCNEV